MCTFESVHVDDIYIGFWIGLLCYSYEVETTMRPGDATILNNRRVMHGPPITTRRYALARTHACTPVHTHVCTSHIVQRVRARPHARTHAATHTAGRRPFVKVDGVRQFYQSYGAEVSTKRCP